MPDTPYESLQITHDGAIATVTLIGPGKGNAMGPASWQEFAPAFEALSADDGVRVVLIRGAGKTFSYGLDLMAMAGEMASLLSGPGAAERTKLFAKIEAMQGAFDAVARCSKPVIAAVHGWCIGAGLDLIAACDIRLSTRNALFSLREAKVGMVADVGSLQRLPPIIGEGATRELAFTAGDVNGERALRMQLVSEIYDDEDALFAAAQKMAEQIAANPPLVMQGVKHVMNARLARDIDAGLREVATWNSAFLPSEDLMEAIAAFADKRAPDFKGR
jgi:enoyl-CoA hydratase